MATVRMLDLSTAHLKNRERPFFGRHRVLQHDYGWIVFVPGGFERSQFQNLAVVREALQTGLHQTPEWLLPIMVEACQEECILINFDSDGDIDPRFQTFEEVAA